jgi:metallo-beta-lactamase family protein
MSQDSQNPAELEIIHHGAKVGVTGSCHELRLGEQDGILIDCGLFQGAEAAKNGSGENRPEIGFAVEHIRALVVTHVHIDHVGRIPYLLAAGFDGPIYCSEPSARLLPLVLEDAVKIGITRNRRKIDKFIDKLSDRLIPVPYGKWQSIELKGTGRLVIRLQPAGHILGSAYIECRVKGDTTGKTEESRVIFSGDLGAPYTPLIPTPRSPNRADIVVLESTYGDRLHEGRKERRRRLREVVELALQDRGVVLVPAFSIGRTQELLYELEEIIHRNQDRFAAKGLPWDELEIIVDSPLAARFTEAFRDLRPFWDAEARAKKSAGRHPLSFDQLTTVDSHQEHKNTVAYLQKTARPSVVLAASGMCAGGRIVNYIKALIGDPRTDMVFVGYQAQGTPGRQIQHYGPGGGYLMLDGRRYPIRARIHSLSSYSAHADQKGLVNFVRRIKSDSLQVRLVHGDAEAKNILKGELEKLANVGEVFV